MEDKVKKIKDSLIINDGLIEGKYHDLDLSFLQNTIEEISDKMIEFAIEIVNDYLSNKEKYDKQVLNKIKEYTNDEIDESSIREQLGIPLISIFTEIGASLFYGPVIEIGNHLPEINIDRDLNIINVSING